MLKAEVGRRRQRQDRHQDRRRRENGDEDDAEPVELRAHASTARPRSAKSPLRSPLDEEDDDDQQHDLALDRADQRLEQLVGEADHQRAKRRAPQVADAAEHDDHEAVDDVALAEIGRDVVDLRKRDPGDPGNAGAEPEGQHVDPRGRDAHRRRHAAVLRHRAHLQAERRRAQHQLQPGEDESGEHDDPQAVGRDLEAADMERARHERRIADQPVVGAEQAAHRPAAG